MNTTMEPALNPEAEAAEEDILYQKDASISAELETDKPEITATPQRVVTTLSPNLEQKVPPQTKTTQGVTESVFPTEAADCPIDCGPGGTCSIQEGIARCQCPLGRGGTTCELGESKSSP